MVTNERGHINRIRQEKYWIEEDGCLTTLNPLASDLRDSIDRLSEGLYSRNAHFIFEIIQNAEDNTYKVKKPTLTFRLVETDPTGTVNSDGALIIYNNETGFASDNVDAICAVGKTTKSKDKAHGYIGEKGIGFKSVFRVTSNPHIFSNGYSFRLPECDEKTGLGYIVPNWVEYLPKGIELIHTTIILPLDKPGFGHETIKQMLRDIEPETILFLSKLKQIIIESDSGDSLTILKDDINTPLVQIHVKRESQKPFSEIKEFLLHVKSIDRPRGITHEKRIDIDRRDVSVAFPLSEDKENAGKIFAYLPVRSDTGLPFLLNADFILTSSREDVLEDEPWNQWLRDQVSDVFIEAFDKWLDIEAYRTKIFRFIPLQANTDYLKPVVASIQNKLKNSEIIPTEPDGQRRKPEHTRTASMRFRSLLSTSPFPKPLLTTRIVLSELELYKTQLEMLDVRMLSFDVIHKCFHDVCWINQHAKDWLIECYRYLSCDFPHIPLSSSPIVPIESENGLHLSCVDEHPIYFERNEECKRTLDESSDCFDVPLAFIDSEVLEAIRDDDILYKWMTNSLRIREFSKNKYANDILTWFNNNYHCISESDFGYTTLFLSRFLENNYKDLPIILADGRRMLLFEALSLPGIQIIVTPETHDPETGWQHIWKTSEDRDHFLALSDCYPKEACDLLIRKTSISLYPLPKHTKDNGYYNKYEDYLPPKWMTQEKYIVNNYEGSTIIAFLKYYSSLLKTWRYEHYSRQDGRYSFRSEKIHMASILKCINNLKWLSTTKGFVYTSQAFLASADIKDILGDSVPYLEEILPDNVIEILGIRTSATVEELISVLEQHAQHGYNSKELAERVYRTLASRELSEDALVRLRESKLIYATSNSQFYWVRSEDAIWKDQKDVFGDDFVYLESTYPKFKDLFVNTIGVKEDVDTEAFARRWLKLQDESGKDSNIIERILTKIYREILIDVDATAPPYWWKGFVDKAKIWTQNKIYETLSTVYVPDDNDLRHVFQDIGIAFAWRPEKDSFSDWEILYRNIGLRYLSESTNISLVEENGHDKSDHAEFLTDSSKILILTWIKEYKPFDYQRLSKGEVIDAFVRTAEARVLSLNVKYNLDENNVVKSCDCYWNREQRELLIKNPSDGHTKNTIARTLARALMPNRAYKELADWIELILGEQDYRWRFQQRSWRIPEELSVWFGNMWDNSANIIDIDSSLESAKQNESNSDKYIPQDKDDISLRCAKNNTSDPNIPIDNVPPQSSQEAFPEQFYYPREIHNVFNRPGETDLKNEPDTNRVNNPERRREKEAIRQMAGISAEPDPTKRHRTTERTLLEGPDEQVRKTLEEWYGGKCQICGSTFAERNGRPFFAAKYMVERKFARQVDTYANALCLCAEHFAKWQHGAVEADNISSQIHSIALASEGNNENLQIRVKICGENCIIKFNEKHVIALQELMNAYDWIQNEVSD